MEGADLSNAVWRKSSRSGTNGAECVEVAAVWRKSSRSGTNGASCVEVAPVDHRVAVRDSKDRTGPVLAFAQRDWTAFVAGIKGGTFGA